MRHDDDDGITLPRIEILESRRFLSTSVFLGGQCLPGKDPVPSENGGGNGGGVSQPGHGGHGDNDDDDDDDDQGGGGNNGGGGDDGGDSDPTPDPNPDPNPNPDPTPPDLEVVTPQVIGDWSGPHATTDQSIKGTISLGVNKSQDGDLFGSVDFVGPKNIRWTGQLLYNVKTGHFTMYYLGSNLVAKFDATLTTDGGAPALKGTVEYYTREGAYKATFDLLHTVSSLPV